MAEQVMENPQQQSVDPAIQQISDFISQSISQGQNPAEVVMSLVEQQIDQQTIGQALMMNGFEENDIMSLFEQMNQGQQPEEQVGGEPFPSDKLNQSPEELTEDERMHADDMSVEDTQEPGLSMGKSGIEIKPENEGKFTRWAEARGMSVQEAASKVMANTDEYPTAVVKMANFAKNAAGWNKEYGGEQYQKGGEKKSIYVESKNDPRYKAYQDSLSLYKESSRDPSYLGNWESNGYKERFIKPYNNLKKLNGVAPKPVSSQGRAAGDYFYQYKYPTQEVIVKEYEKVYNTPQVNPIQNYLNPQELVYSDNDIETDANIKVPIRTPKYYDVIDKVNQNFGGSESKYKYYPENGDLPNIAPSPYNTRTMVPNYYMGGVPQGKVGAVNNSVINNKDMNWQRAPLYINPMEFEYTNDNFSLGKAAAVAYGGYKEFLSGEDENKDGFKDGFFRDSNKKSMIPTGNNGQTIPGMMNGGDLDKAQFGIPETFDISDPFGFKNKRFGQTANYADTKGYTNGEAIRQPSYSTPGFVEGMGVGEDGYGGADNTRYDFNNPNVPNPNINYEALNNFKIGEGINDNASLSYGDPYAADGVNFQMPAETAMTPADQYGKGVSTDKFEGGLNRFLEGYGKLSNFAVQGANVINDYFRDQNINQAKEDNFNKLGADYQYATAEDPFNKRGLWDVNTGTAGSEGDRTTGLYMSKYGGENNTVNVDSNLLAKLIAAGADIEIL